MKADDDRNVWKYGGGIWRQNECWLGGITLAFDSELQYNVGGGGNAAAADLHDGEGGGGGCIMLIVK